MAAKDKANTKANSKDGVTKINRSWLARELLDEIPRVMQRAMERTT